MDHKNIAFSYYIKKVNTSLGILIKINKKDDQKSFNMKPSVCTEGVIIFTRIYYEFNR